MKREYYPDQVINYNRNGWKGDIYWTPSQLYKTIKIDNKTYELRTRWRHSDPWDFYIDDKGVELDREYLAEEYEELIDYIDEHIEEIIKEKINVN
jgi:hypothetical protein